MNNILTEKILLEEPEDIQVKLNEEPKEEIETNAFVSMLNNAISDELNSIENIKSYITTITLENPEQEDIAVILNQIVDEKTIHVGMLQKAISLLDNIPSELMSQGEEKASELIGDKEEEIEIEGE